MEFIFNKDALFLYLIRTGAGTPTEQDAVISLSLMYFNDNGEAKVIIDKTFDLDYPIDELTTELTDFADWAVKGLPKISKEDLFIIKSALNETDTIAGYDIVDNLRFLCAVHPEITFPSKKLIDLNYNPDADSQKWDTFREACEHWGIPLKEFSRSHPVFNYPLTAGYICRRSYRLYKCLCTGEKYILTDMDICQDVPF